MMDSAAEELRPTRIICAFPLVCRAKASAIPCPTPEVPPTKTAQGRYEGENEVFKARMADIDGAISNMIEGWRLPCQCGLYIMKTAPGRPRNVGRQLQNLVFCAPLDDFP